jgi:outer membrane protein assembly factor BamB
VGAAVQRPVVADGTSVVVAPTDGSIDSLDVATGEPRWTLPERSVATGAPVLLPTGDLAWIDPRGAVRVCAMANGRPVQRPPVTAILRGTPAAGDDDRLWAFAEDESLRLLSASAGTVLRRFPAPRAFLDVPPVAAGDRAYFASQDGTVYAVRADGEVVLRKRLDQAVPAGVAVANGRIYAGCAAGTLHVLDATSGEELWRFDAGARITARPVIAGGTVYVVTAGGSVFALEE